MIKTFKFWRSFILLSIIIIPLSSNCEDNEPVLMDYFPDIKVTESNDPAPGHYFFGSKILYPEVQHDYLAIVDNYGTPVFFRLMEGKKSSMRLIEDGRIVFWSGKPRVLYFLNEMLEVESTMSTKGYKSDGHDWDISPEGNILLLGKDDHKEDLSNLVDGGLEEVTVQDIVVQEFDKDKNLLYTWKSRDHFDILDALGESDLVFYTSDKLDYVHPNSVHFDSDTSFLLSSRHLNEITKIDRRTQEIIWRLGGKNNDFTFINDDLGFSHQHSVSRTAAGTILIFDNGNTHPEPRFSSSVEYLLDEVNMTATLINRYRRTPDLLQEASGATQRTHNGNTLITWVAQEASVTEFHPDGSIAAEFSWSDHGSSNRIEKFLWETKIFETDKDTIDFGAFDGSNPITKTLNITNNIDAEIAITSYSTHTDLFKVTTNLPLTISALGSSQLEIEFDPSITDIGYIKDLITLNHEIDTQLVARQVHLFGTQDDEIVPDAEILPIGTDISIDTFIVVNLTEPIKILNEEELNYSNIDDYIVFREDDVNGNDVAFDAIINSNKTEIRIIPREQLKNGCVYYVCVLANLSDYCDNALPLHESSFETKSNVGINDQPGTTTENITLYPNPNNGKFRINTEDYEIKRISIFDLRGRLVYSNVYEEPTVDIDISDQAKGQYIVKIEDKYKKLLKTLKLIIN